MVPQWSTGFPERHQPHPANCQFDGGFIFGHIRSAVNNPIGPVANSQLPVVMKSLPRLPAGYAALIMSHHPSAYWRLDETSGTNFYDVAGGLNGTYVVSNAVGAGLTLGLPGVIRRGDSGSLQLVLAGVGANRVAWQSFRSRRS